MTSTRIDAKAPAIFAGGGSTPVFTAITEVTAEASYGDRRNSFLIHIA
ncbi:MAG: hypothetical protein ACLU9N_03155 [Clostridia bacterium]